MLDAGIDMNMDMDMDMNMDMDMDMDMDMVITYNLYRKTIFSEREKVNEKAKRRA